jgi:hypothetical protein
MEFDHVGRHHRPDLPPIQQELSRRRPQAAGMGLMIVSYHPSTSTHPLEFWIIT